MRIIVFSSNSKSANAGMIGFLNKHKEDIAALVIVTQLKGNFFSRFKSFVKYSKRTSMRFLLYKIYEGFGGTKVISEAKKLRIPVFKTNNINDSSFIGQISSINADLFICFFVNQILRKEILSVPKIGTLNSHGSLLPEYKGAAQYFWYLYNEDKHGGITIHFMDEKLDAGDIVLQEKFDINPKESMFNIHIKLGKLSAKLYSDVIEQLKSESLKRIPQTYSDSKYLTLPTKSEMNVFLKKGFRIF